MTPGMPMRVGQTGGPGSPDPGRATWTNMSLRNLVMQAYNLRPYQLTGPQWLDSSRFEVTVKIPEGTTREQFRLMLQSMLEERFKLTFHNESKEMPIYELVVAKNGPKLKEAAPPPAPNPDGPPAGPPAARPFGPPKIGADGFPVLAPDQRQGMIMMNGKARSRSSNQTLDQVAGLLSGQVGRPVTNATGLTGKYDYEIFWASEGSVRAAPPSSEAGAPAASEESGPTIFMAVQEQLGLKLVEKKGPVQVMVVDHLEKSPTEN
jgi:uncharacterized protein (TIGR03435 family)